MSAKGMRAAPGSATYAAQGTGHGTVQSTGGGQTGPSIGADLLRRWLCSIIEAHQERIVRAGALPEAARLAPKRQSQSNVDIDGICLDERGLGFDSLARLDLVEDVARTFGLQSTGAEDYLVLRRTIGDWIETLAWHLQQVGRAAEITFATSGTTGAPKHVTHGLAALDTEIDALLTGPLADTGRPERVLALVPPHHIYGCLWTVLLPSRCACPVIDVPPGLPGAVARVARPGDLVVATPFAWHALGRGPALPPGVVGVTAGAPSTPETWAAAKAIGLAGLIEIYGASETGGIGWRRAGSDDYTLLPHIARDGPDLRAGPDGNTTLAVQDHMAWTGPRRFTLAGRRDDVVQIAGVNVDLADLRRAMIVAAQAKDVAIRRDGDRLKAYVVPGPAGETETAAAIHRFLADRPAASRPAHITYGPQIPHGPTGKPTGW
ncbi:MAG: 4-coumarate--CoA ligase [Pseudomonadota bacterium]